MSMTDKMVTVLVRSFRLDEGDHFKKYGYFEGFLSIVLNVILSVLKFVFGTLLNSVSLIADALHSLTDVISSIIVVFGFKISAKPPDEKHPFGHGRAERIVSIIVACLLIVVGFEFFMSGFERFRNPIPIRSDVLVISMLIASIFIKEFLYQVSMHLGRRINSASLKADALHHRTDAISTVLVLIGFVCFRFGLFSLDGLMGMAVALIIVYAGVSIIIESGNFLIGQAPSSSLVDKIKVTAAQCDGVNDIHHIHVHDYGGQLEVTIHVRMKSKIHLVDAHQKASEVEDAIKRCVPGAEVTVHLEPFDEERKNS